MSAKISVIIPVYNSYKYLNRCLNSVLNQDLKEIEIICVDDGSTDASLELLNQYAANDDRIKLYHQENQGPADARNRGLSLACGEYVEFLDSDDFIKEGCLKSLYEKAKLNAADMLVFQSQYQAVKENGIFPNMTPFGDGANVISGSEVLFQLAKLDDMFASPCLYLVKRELIEKNNIKFPFHMRSGEDASFTIELFFRAARVVIVNKVVHFYCKRENSVSTSKADLRHSIDAMFQFYECFRLFYMMDLNDKEKETLCHFLQSPIQSAREYGAQFTISEELELENQKEPIQMLSKMLNVSRQPFGGLVNNIEIFENIISKYHNVILYGAGKIGNQVFKFFERKKLEDKLMGFAETSSGRSNVLYPLAVKRIFDYRASDSVLVILSASERYHDAMFRTAKNCGFNNILPVDVYLLRDIAKC